MPTNSTRSLTRSTELIAQNSKEPQRCGSFLYMLLLQQRGFGSAHSVGVRLLDVPLVQPCSPWGTPSRRKRMPLSTSFLPLRWKARCPGQSSAQLGDDGGADACADEHLRPLQLVPQGKHLGQGGCPLPGSWRAPPLVRTVSIPSVAASR